ncbi:DUF2267 domain-containing protein [Kitasatospora herbaricolor]|uniref:DUF2267 domain-containing protein n=1 Tax=Kitasatospora herbaricolor TaxID=68217 RepID=A0ABZ1WHG9_9ACTN|nr:DUF2267 domain-containing protein [Kitasatospora herbaricolor]
MTLRWEAFLEEVRERGAYDGPHDAERAARVVLALLGAHLAGEVRAHLAARLPETLALVLLNPLQAAEPLSPDRFVRATAAVLSTTADAAGDDPLVESVATALNTTPLRARWDVTSVLAALTAHTGDPLTDRLLAQLPRGYALLFGRADLTTAA